MKPAVSFFCMSMCFVALSACDKADPTTPVTANSEALFIDSARTMVLVAHQDDDLGLLNPDLVHTIRAGKTVRTVMLTSGDANFPCPSEHGYIKGRETGHLAGYAEMAQAAYDPQNPDAAWAEPPATEIPGMPGIYYRLRTLIANPKISVVYLALPNDDQMVLEKLWNDTTGTLAFDTHEPDTRRPTSSYTRAKLINALLWLMNDFQPTQISTLDSTKLWPLTWPFEHTDHLHSALFALAAAQRYTQPHTLRMYRTYNIMVAEPENVTPAEAQFKATLLNETYGEWDAWFPNTGNNFCPSGEVTICGKTDICQDPALFWDGLDERQYTIAPVHGAGSVGGIAGPAAGKCLQASGTTAGSTITLQTCNVATANQQFRMLSDGTIRQKSSNLCVAANGASALARPRNIGLTLRTCPETPLSEHKFALMTNGQLRGPDATCVQANGSALAIQECADNSNQLDFKPQFSPAPFTAAASGYADAQIPNDTSSYRTLDMADIDADGDPDVCVRRTGGSTVGGIWCSNYSAGTFSAPTRRIAQFMDSQSYNQAQFGSTVQLADINKDNRADVCGRGTDGIYCAHWTAGVLGNYSRRSTAFVGGYSGIGSYASIRFVDVNKDGFADVCGRNANGIECGLNNGAGQFNAPTQWLSIEFTNALGWSAEDSGGTMMYGDIDGDGLTDVCGRGAEGIRCAIHAPSVATNAFVDPHFYGASDDFDDAGGWFLFRHSYGSLRLADINGDGRADICGRGMWGLHCGISMGSSFGLSQKMIPVNPYDEATGWSVDRYGSTMMFGDLNADGHQDVCGRGPIPGGGVGLRCAFAP